MKFLLIATLLVSMAHADEKEENITQVKASISANIDQKISQLQTHKSCVQAANDREQLKNCKKSNREAMKKLHEENKSEKESWKSGRNERKEKRKAEKNATKTN